MLHGRCIVVSRQQGYAVDQARLQPCMGGDLAAAEIQRSNECRTKVPPSGGITKFRPPAVPLQKIPSSGGITKFCPLAVPCNFFTKARMFSPRSNESSISSRIHGYSCHDLLLLDCSGFATVLTRSRTRRTWHCPAWQGKGQVDDCRNR